MGPYLEYLSRHVELAQSVVYFHHRFLTPAISRQWVRMTDPDCRLPFVRSIVPLGVRQSDVMSSFRLSILGSPGLPFYLTSAIGKRLSNHVARLMAFERSFGTVLMKRIYRDMQTEADLAV